MKYYKITEAAKMLGVTRQTLINWSKTGRFKEHHRTPSGHRYYSEEQIKELNGEVKEDKKED